MKLPQGARCFGGGPFSVAGALCVALLASGCAVEKPQMPRSAIAIRIPVANDTTTLEDVVDDPQFSDFLAIRDDKSIALQFNRDFTDAQGRVEVGDRLAVTPQSTEFATAIGEIAIPGQSVQLPPIEARNLLPEAILDQEVPLPVPATPLAGIEEDVALEGVESLSVSTGSLTLTITNGLPIPLVDFEFTLVDNGNNGRTVDTAQISSIGTGSTESAVFDLTGETISGNLAIVLAGGTGAADGVTIASDDALEISVELSRLGVEQATAVIEQQEIAPGDPTVLEFPDDRIQVTRAVIDRGSITLVVTNQLPVLMEVTLQLLELIDPSTGGPPTWVIDDLATGTPREVVFPLAGHIFQPADPLQLRITYAGRTQPTGEPVTIRSNAELLVEAVTEELAFSEISGRLNRLRLPEIDPQTRFIDLPTGADTLNAVILDSAGMSVTYTSAVGVPASMALNIVGAKSAIPDSAGIERVIQIEAELEQGSPEIPVTSTLDVAPGQLLGFLNLMPTEVTVSVDSVLIGKGGGLADTILVRPDHWVRLDNVEFIAPARVTIDTSFFENPAESQGNFTDAEARERINANIDSASVTTTIFNQIPVSVGVRLFTGYDPATVFSDPVLTVPKGAGEFFSVAPNATEERRVSLTADDLRLLLDIDPNDPRPLSGPPPRTLYTGVKVRVAAPTGEQVFANDIVVVQAQTEIFIELNESLIQ